MLQHPYQYVQTYIGLAVEPSLLAHFPDTMEWQGNKLLKKDEFHVTICKGEDVFAEVAERGMERSEAEERLLTLFSTFVERTPIKLISFVNDFPYIQDNERGRKSIVVRCRVSNLSGFFAELNRTFKINFPLQPTHVTLYTLQKNMGIHIATETIMENLARVHLPEFEVGLPEMSDKKK